MPIVLNPELYRAVNIATKHVYANRAFNGLVTTVPMGTSLYRFVKYYEGRGVLTDEGRIIRAPLERDLNNRWTGQGLTPRDGFQGLYLAWPNQGSADMRHYELEHYIKDPEPKYMKVTGYIYEPGKPPRMEEYSIDNAFSMFLYDTNMDIKGLDLQFNEASIPALVKVLELVNKIKRGLIPEGKPLEEVARDLYYASDDASFTRGLANGIWEMKQHQFIRFSSVRGDGITLVIVGETGKEISVLKSRGRCTYARDGRGNLIAFYTTDDMLHNARYEGPSELTLVSKEEQLKTLKTFEAQVEEISKTIDWSDLTTSIDNVVREHVLNTLQTISNPFDQGIAVLESQLLTAELGDKVRSEMKDFVLMSAATSAQYDQLQKEIGAEGVDSLFSTQLVDTKYMSLFEGQVDGSTYISAAVRSALLEQKAHWLSENSSSIQQRIVELGTKQSQTSTELSSKQAALEEIEVKLKEKPDDAMLTSQKEALNKEIGALVKEQQEAQRELEQENQRDTENKAEADKTTRDKEAVDEYLKKRRPDVLSGE